MSTYVETYVIRLLEIVLEIAWLFDCSLGFEKVDSISSNRSSTSDIGSSSIEKAYHTVCIVGYNNFVYQDPGGAI